jgi:hypothetical protein
MTVTLLKTIPSGSHNAPYNEEIGSHWPAGQQFKLLSKHMHATLRKWFHLGPGRVAVEQIGGEEVIVSVPAWQFQELFGMPAPEID